MNYSELTDLIKEYTENTETTFVANINDFIRQAEERIYRSVLIPELRKNVTGTVSSGTPYLARPTDFLSVFSLAVLDGSSNYSYLLDKEVNFIREAYPSASTTGLPKYYGIFDGDTYSGGSETSNGHFILGPTPDSNYSIELHYYYDPPSIITSTTSWLGDNAETTLLYGCLLEAYTFMKGDSQIFQMYSQRYMESLREMASLGVKLKTDTYKEQAA